MTQLITDRMAVYEMENVVLKNEIEALRGKVHDTLVKLQSATQSIEHLQDRNRCILSHH